MTTCIFCRRSPADRYAVTVQRGEFWERVVEPVCARCHVLLAGAGEEGRRVKDTGEMWWLGHGTGLFPKVEPGE